MHRWSCADLITGQSLEAVKPTRWGGGGLKRFRLVTIDQGSIASSRGARAPTRRGSPASRVPLRALKAGETRPVWPRGRAGTIDRPRWVHVAGPGPLSSPRAPAAVPGTCSARQQSPKSGGEPADVTIFFSVGCCHFNGHSLRDLFRHGLWLSV